jgi:hypothetical protein
MIDKIPVVDIQAKDKAEAGALLLACNSQHGKITGDGLYEFTHDIDLDPMGLEAFDLPDIDLDDYLAEYFECGDVEPEEESTPENKSKACPNCGYEG